MSAPTPPTGRAHVPSGPSDHYSARARVSESGGLPPEDGGSRPYRSRPRPRWDRIALVVGVVVLVVALCGFGGAYLYAKNLDKKVARTDPFSSITGGRPAKTVAGAQNILLLGSDSRDPENKAKAGQWRTDTIILMHIPASHDHAYLISIPRDLYVSIPKSQTNPSLGGTREKINAAFAWGGLPLMVQTVEGLTGVRIDHVALIDFGGFKEVTDALGGVDMYVDQTITSIHKPHRVFRKGMRHFDGAQALDYVRQRYQFAQGDFTRMKHQQEFLKAIMDKAASTGTLANPAKLNAFLQAVTRSMTVDKDFSLVDMAIQFRSLRSKDMTFMVSPNAGSANVNGESVVLSDKPRALALYEAVSSDKVADWMKQASPAAKTGG
jgi:LCP family protein required for cell wall assembly